MSPSRTRSERRGHREADNQDGRQDLLTSKQVLDAGRDFSERRADVWPNMKVKHPEVHQRGNTSLT